MDIGELLESSGAILKGHFLLTSGRHSAVYFEKFRILEQPAVLSELCRQMVESLKDEEFDLVAGPTTGGIIIAFEVARQLGIKALYVETEQGKRAIRRGATIETGKRVLVVDDVLTTGLSVHETMAAIQDRGGIVKAVGVLIDRATMDPGFGVRYVCGYKVEAESFAEEEIPEWLAAIPVTKPGTRIQLQN